MNRGFAAWCHCMLCPYLVKWSSGGGALESEPRTQSEPCTAMNNSSVVNTLLPCLDNTNERVTCSEFCYVITFLLLIVFTLCMIPSLVELFRVRANYCCTLCRHEPKLDVVWWKRKTINDEIWYTRINFCSFFPVALKTDKWPNIMTCFYSDP